MLSNMMSTFLLIGTILFSMFMLVFQVIRILGKHTIKNLSVEKGSQGYGVFYAFTKGMLPWKKESGRLHPVVFGLGALYHICLFLSLLILCEKLFIGIRGSEILRMISVIPAMGAVLGLFFFFKRIFSSDMREFSVLDDYISVLLTVIFMLGALSYSAVLLEPRWFDYSAIIMFLYLPSGKIKHMVTFFISRYFHGKILGMLGIYSPDAKPRFGKYDPESFKPSNSTLNGGAENGERGEYGQVEITDAQIPELTAQMDKVISRNTLSMMNACIHCGMCTESCHYYLSMDNRDLIPVAKMDRFSSIYRKHHDSLGSPVFMLLDAKKLTPENAVELHQIAYEYCSLCGRCGMTCPMGINTGEVMREVRGAFANIGAEPIGLRTPAVTAIEKGNYLGLPVDDVVENIEWLGEELSGELEIEGVEIPLNKENADVLFIPHPLELRDFPLTVMAAAKIFHKAGIDYTLSSESFDVVNYAYYGGNHEHMKAIMERLVKTQEKLKAKTVVLSPCGHGYKVLRWEAEKTLGYKFPFKVLLFAEVIDQYIREKKITLKKDAVAESITYHDPCNIARNGGVIEEPRRILRELSTNFIEMSPAGEWNFCCGGGGGLASTGEFGKTRLLVGRVKAEQVQQTGAKAVITNCFNCTTQLKEITKKYGLKTDVVTLTEIVADSLE